MSSIKLYRRFIATPRSNSSPGLAYFTPTKFPKSKNSSNFLQLKEPYFYPTTSSAEWFKKREKKFRKYRYYQKSPCVPKYIRYQSIKKRLIFNESPNLNKKSNLNTSSNYRGVNQMKLIVPSITLTSPQTSSKNAIVKHQSDCSCIQIHTPNIKRTATPNIHNLIKNLLTYSSHQLLGRGRFGSVIKTKYKGKTVAVKVIHKNRDKIKPILLREQHGIGLNHHNIVNVNLVAWSNNIGAIIMECFDTARNLQSLIDNDMFEINIQRILGYSLDICRALDYLHLNKILHLDVKPKNVLTLPSGVCKLCDFGTSYKNGDKLEDNYLVSQFQGTTRYCAPEILKGNFPTTKSDIYSLGITFWQIIHRTTPYGYGIREESLIYQVVKNGLRPTICPSLCSCAPLRAYKNIYVGCWSANFIERHNIDFIIKQLQNIARYSNGKNIPIR